MPGGIAKAIALTKAKIGAVKYDKKHPRGYEYASADAVYEAVHDAMAEEGLTILTLESEVAFQEVGKERWGKFTFEFLFATAEASWSDPRCKRTVFHRIFGPESHQSAQSYADKAFLRSTFKLKTGDADEIDADLEKPRRSKASLKAEGGEWDQFRGAVDEAGSYGELAEVEMKWRGKFPVSWENAVADEITARRNQLDRQFGEAA